MTTNFRLLDIKTNKLVDSLFVGNYKTKFKSKGIEFADFREYQQGDDSKSIDWVTSQKEGKPMIKLYDEERELTLYFLVDISPDLLFDIHGDHYKKNAVYEIVSLLSLSAIKGGDKFGAYFFQQDNQQLLQPKKGKLALKNILNGFSHQIDTLSVNQPENTQEKIGYFNSLKVSKSLVFLITSSFSLDDKQLKILALKHDLVVVHLFHSFENYLGDSGLKHLTKKSQHLYIDLDNEDKKNEYKSIRKEKILNFKSKVHNFGADYIYLDETKDVYTTLLSFMKNRS